MIQAYRIRLEYGKCEGVTIVENARPHIEWAVLGGAQAAYRASVTSDAGLLWDTGWVASAETGLSYAGAPLTPGDLCRLKIEVKDETGKIGAEADAEFAYGAIEWRAKWIGEAEPKEDAVVVFTKTIRLDKAPLRAAAFVCALAYGRVKVNGVLLEDVRLDPALSEYDKRCYYKVYPSLALRAGDNEIEIAVGSGWRSRFNACYNLGGYETTGRRPEYAGDTLLSASFRVTLEGGETIWFDTGDDWRMRYDKIVYSNIFAGETYDANAETPALPVRIAPSPTLRMQPQTLEPVRPREVYPAVCVSEIKPGVYAVDFGQNIAGVCRLRLPKGMRKGAKITLNHMEFLDEDGSLYLANLRTAKCEDNYIASGDENDLDVWEPTFTYHGFRYAEVRGLNAPLTKDDISAVSLYTDIAARSYFRSGSAQVNAIQKLVTQTEKANLHSILTDCPQRDERMGWMNDATVRFEETPYNFDVGRLFPKVVRDLIDVQGEDGSITCTAPFAFGGRPADPVCSSFLVAGWQAYLHTGNKDILREAYDAFAAWDDCLEALTEDGIVQLSRYGDWAGPSYACQSPELPLSAATPGILMSTGYHYYNNVLLIKMADVIGRDASDRQALADKTRKAFLAKWWDGETGKVATGSQGCQSFALWLDILPETGREKAARVLRDDLVARDYKFTTGNLCTRYMMDELARYGYVNEAYELLLRETYPSFGFMMQQEATTVWERFELKKESGMNSHNHPMYGAVGYWFYAYLTGIRPTDAGFARAKIEPYYPDKLQSAQSTVETPRGDLTVRWVKRYGALHLYVTVPEGMVCDVRAPGENATVGAGFHHWQRAL